jgi:hypothetical protein
MPLNPQPICKPADTKIKGLCGQSIEGARLGRGKFGTLSGGNAPAKKGKLKAKKTMPSARAFLFLS